jgi:CubicO group peptidase (beta-lactamase class C family)
MKTNVRGDTGTLDDRLAAIADKPRAELSSLVILVLRDGEVVHEAAFGRRCIHPMQPELDCPATPDTLYRVASISKPVTALAAMSLVETGQLDLQRDVSDYLGWPLRNPHWPDRGINSAMLLSHVSSLRDGQSYTMPLGAALREFFIPEGRGWEAGAHFASPLDRPIDRPDHRATDRPADRLDNQPADRAQNQPSDLSPGQYFTYCNLGFGVLATVIEAISGERFDRYVKQRILEPLGMEASFNVNLLSDSAFARLAPLYRKGCEGQYDPDGAWVAQVDDYQGVRPRLPCPSLPGLGPADLEAWTPGLNGSCFSPQGGMRASIRDLARLIGCFIGRGVLGGRRILEQRTIEGMMRPYWTFDPLHVNGNCYNGITRETGLALMHTTDAWDSFGGDRLLANGGPMLWGHHADAYGLLGGMLFHPDDGYGFAYLLGGSAADPETLRGRHSSFCLWEEEIHTALLEFILG